MLSWLRSRRRARIASPLTHCAYRRGVNLPSNLSASLRAYPADTAERWVASLPQTLRDASERWSLDIAEPFQPGGVTSYVAPATRSDGASLVYKVTIPHDESRFEVEALRAYGGEGAVALVEAEPPTWELLLERARPGLDLWTVGDDHARMEIVCEIAQRLWRPLVGSGIPALPDVARSWASITEGRLVTADVPWITDPIERGIELLRTLPSEPHDAMLLHGDLHPGNVLSAERVPWLAIDPKPLVGDPAFEPIQLLTQRAGRIAEPPPAPEVEERLTTIADLLGLDATRVARWGIARCAEWSMWSWNHGDTIDAAIAYTWARTLDRLA